MALALLAALTLLITEYGFQSRAGIVEGFTAKWRSTRTLVRLATWFLMLLAIGLRPLGLLVVGLGFVLSELGAVALRRRMRIDIEMGRPHGLPITHMIPIAVGILYFAILSSVQLGVQVELRVDPLRQKSLALAITACVIALWGWATMVTVSVVDLVHSEVVQVNTVGSDASEIIGVLERLVTFMLVVAGGFMAVGFLIAAKTAARLLMFKTQANADYFLIGTFTSVGLALLLGLMVQALR